MRSHVFGAVLGYLLLPALIWAWAGVRTLAGTPALVVGKVGEQSERVIIDSPVDCYNGAIHASEEGDDEAALELYDCAIMLDPKFEQAYVNRASIHSDQGRDSQAMQDLNRAITLDPRDALAWNNRGNLRSKIGHYNEAISDFKKALRLKKDDLGTIMGIGHAYEKLRHFEESLRWFRKAVQVDPKDAEALRSRALLLIKTLKPDAALKDLEKLRRMREPNREIETMEGAAKEMKTRLADPALDKEGREEVRRLVQGG